MATLDTTRVAKELDAARAFARSLGLVDDLESNLERLARLGPEGRTRVTLYPDGAPYSFGFVVELRESDGLWRQWLAGGLLFHGPHDGHGSGGAPTFATTLEPTTGWMIHT